jgi:glycosyltransferase involved in cell wall biosynthesis
MAPNSTSSFRVKLGDIDNFHGTSGRLRAGARSRGGNVAEALATPVSPASPLAEVHPFTELASRLGRPLRVAILSDFTRIPYANGAVFQTRFLYQELRRCGHEVTVIGPSDPESRPEDLAPGTIALPSLPLKTYPGVHVPLPLASWVAEIDRWDFDLCFAQTTSMLMEFGVWLREMKGIPLICVNTTHLTAAYDVLLPEKLSKIPAVHKGLEALLKRPYENLFTNLYNRADGLIVLSEGLKTYWRDLGVSIPIHVIGRSVQPEVFDKPLGPDPYTHLLNAELHGPRLLSAGRHTREKAQDRLIRIFAEHVLPAEPDATLTVIGQGPDTEYYKRVAEELGVAHRVFFTGEVPFTTMADYYAYADIFVHASLSETFGNVLGEALWCGTPTVAFKDGMGVTAQIDAGVNGVLVHPGRGLAQSGDDLDLMIGSEEDGDQAFGRAVVGLIQDPQLRGRLGKAAAKRARDRSSPRAIQQKMADAFLHARQHLLESGLVPAVGRSKPVQWLTTFRRFRQWLMGNGGVYLFGHLRPAKWGKGPSVQTQLAG